MSLRAPKGAWQSYRKVLRLLHFVRNDSFLTLFLGRALDLGMGEGRNAVYLAKQEYEVEGVDISSNAVQKAVSSGQSQGVQVNGIAVKPQ
ncbi:MAG: methyltransferase domain-containing protein [Nitrospirae bacterium]|nr:methyltransferase domain-containing protein [Nitrospirota bacterium]MBI3351410.1 methyltransferase domain-containing protein [Nitrospirota bacterium]